MGEPGQHDQEPLRLVMLGPTSADARLWRRCDMFRDLGASVTVMAFRRRHLVSLERRDDWVSLGTVRNRKYLARIPVLLAAIPKVLGQVRRGDVVYCYGLDLLALAAAVSVFRGGTCALVQETIDIRAASLGPGLGPRLLRALERFLLRRTALVVVTSSRYMTHFYHEQLGATETRFFLLANKPGLVTLPPRAEGRHERNGDTLVIGYFGMLRCHRSWEFLVRLAEADPDRIRIVTAGLPVGIDGFEDAVASHANIEHLGTYEWPEDLSGLYGRVDIVWTVYPSHEPNRLWARTNRYYEAGYFRKPMITAVGSADGVELERAGLGLLVDLDSPDTAMQKVLGIDEEQLAEWERAYDGIDVSEFTTTDEEARLLEVLRGLRST